MGAREEAFQRSVREQIALNLRRTPTERMLALCELLDSARALAPTHPEARHLRLRALAARQREREQVRADFRRFLAAGGGDTAAGV